MFFANEKGLAQFDKAGGKNVNGQRYVGIRFAGRDGVWYAHPNQLKGRVVNPEECDDLNQSELDSLWTEIEGTESVTPQATTVADLEELPEDED
jgi:hypothetical protein